MSSAEPPPEPAPEPRAEFVIGIKASAARVERMLMHRLARRMLAEYGRGQIYEWLHAHLICKPVFDIDGKVEDTTAQALLTDALAALATFFGGALPPGVIIASSHGGDKLSYRLFVPGYRMRLGDIKKRILRLGLDGRAGGPFDPAIYGSSQKLRMPGSIKTPQDTRNLKLIDATHHDVEPTLELLLATIVQNVDEAWPLLEEPEEAPKAPPKRTGVRKTAPQVPLEQPLLPQSSPTTSNRTHSDTAASLQVQLRDEPASKRSKKASLEADPAPNDGGEGSEGGQCTEHLSSGFKTPEDRDRALRLLTDNGFVDPQFIGLPRPNSLTFKADNRAQCPCCNHDHDRHNWFATQDQNGMLLAKSYSARCRLTPMKPVPQIAVDNEASQALIKERLAIVERRQDQTDLDVTVIKNTLLDFGPHIQAALNQDIAVASVVMRPDAHGFAFNCSNDRNDYSCDIIATPTCRLSCTSDRSMPPIIAGWAGNVIINDIINNPEKADTAYVDWFRRHEKNQLGIDWCFDHDFFFTDGGTWTRVTTGKDGNLEYLEQRFLALLAPRLALLNQIASSGIMPPDMDAAEKKRIKTGARRAYNHIQHWRTTKALVQAARVNFYVDGFEKGMDRDRHVLGTPDGVVDLRTGLILAPGHGLQVSMRTKAKYAGLDLPTTDVERVFTTIFDGDQPMVRWFQLFLGMTLTGEKTETYACFTGSGANGKSLTLDWIHQAIGSQYYCEADRSIFFGARQGGGATPYLADLLSRRLAVFQECDPTQDPLNTAELKRNTGNSPFTARRLYCAPFELDPTHTQILATNSLPKFDGTDYAVVRRCVVVPFHMQFKHGAEYDPTQPFHRPADVGLEAFLHAPARCEQLLVWMIKGAVDWYAAGTPKLSAQTPQVMQDAKRAYVEDNDPLGSFIAEHCVVNPTGTVVAKVFNERAPNLPQGVAPVMAKKGFPRKKKGPAQQQQWCYVGLSWLADP